MRVTGFFIALAIAFSFSMTSANAHDQASVRTGVSPAYAGTFHWRKDPTEQKVRIDFESVIDGAVGKVWAFGKGLYETDGRTTNIRVRALIDPDNMRLRMWELAPDKDSFVTDGEHKGRLSSDLKTIKAVWRTNGTRQKGDLILNAP